MEICNVCKTPHFLCLSGISRDCELRSAQPISAPSHSAGEQPCAAGRAALSTAGFVMLQLGAGYLSPFTYSGLHFPSFSLINKWKKYILKKKKKKKKGHPWLTEPWHYWGHHRVQRLPSKANSSDLQKVSIPPTPPCLTEHHCKCRAASAARLSPLPTRKHG